MDYVERGIPEPKERYIIDVVEQYFISRRIESSGGPPATALRQQTIPYPVNPKVRNALHAIA